MNYKHIFHAGNLADVFKHAVLSALVLSLQKKDKPFVYIDSHAGAGCYDLFSDKALRTREAQKGILALMKSHSLESSPKVLKPYLQTIAALNSSKEQKVLETSSSETPAFEMTLSETKSSETQLVAETKVLKEEKKSFYYPGSPLLVKGLARAEDELILNELRPDDYVQLKQLFHQDKKVACHQRDAYEFLPGVLPPKIKRGLILIDPAYEVQHEDRKVTETVKSCIKKFSQGIYVIWYPIKADQSYYHDLKRWLYIQKIPYQVSEYAWTEIKSENLGILGSGLLIINPPWKFSNQLSEIKKVLM